MENVRLLLWWFWSDFHAEFLTSSISCLINRKNLYLNINLPQIDERKHTRTLRLFILRTKGLGTPHQAQFSNVTYVFLGISAEFKDNSWKQCCNTTFQLIFLETPISWGSNFIFSVTDLTLIKGDLLRWDEALLSCLRRSAVISSQ